VHVSVDIKLNENRSKISAGDIQRNVMHNIQL
jgi:hypothetical protein